MPERKRPTLSTIAAEVGISASAVSLALKGHHSIPERTREKVLKAAEKIGYQQDANLSRLMSYLRHAHKRRDHPVIAYVTNTPQPAYWKVNNYNAQLFKGLKSRADILGYKIEEFWISDKRGGYPMKSLPRVLRARGIEAVILDPHMGMRYDEFDLKYFACAAICEEDVTDPPIHRATLYREQTIYDSLVHLKEQGYRRIGFVLPWAPDHRETHYLPFLAGFLSFQELHVPEADRIPSLRRTVEDDWDPVAAVDWRRKWEPDMILMLDFRIIDTLKEVGLRYPDDIGLAYADWTPEQKPMAGIWQHRERTAAHALELVDAQLRRNESGYPEVAKVVFVKGTWVPGGTVHEPASAPDPEKVKKTRKTKAVKL
jgi:LacI family transcriptional regulator